jgi:hypothetical protein
MHLKSKWRTTALQQIELSKLSLTYHHMKDSYSPTCDSIQKFGLDYPLMIWKCTEDQWMKYFNDPCYTLNEDGFIYGVMKGNMKTLIAKSLNYTTIDSMIYQMSDDALKMGVWHDHADPLHNHQCEPYRHILDYTVRRKPEAGRHIPDRHDTRKIIVPGKPNKDTK